MVSTAPTDAPPTFGIGRRLPYQALPGQVRRWIESQLPSSLTAVHDQRGGFSPGVAAVVESEEGGLFVKAVSDQINPDSPGIYRSERDMMTQLPTLPGVPQLLASAEIAVAGHDWVVLVSPLIQGRTPTHPWSAEDVVRVLDSLVELKSRASESRLPELPDRDAATREFFAGWHKLAAAESAVRWRSDPWVDLHLDQLVRGEAEVARRLQGSSLSHFDLRADNIIMTPVQVWFVDWAHPRLAAEWLDAAILLADFVASGADVASSPRAGTGGTVDIADLIRTHPSLSSAEPKWIYRLLGSFAATMHVHSTRPAAPGLPTIRQWQAHIAEPVLDFVRRHVDEWL